MFPFQIRNTRVLLALSGYRAAGNELPAYGIKVYVYILLRILSIKTFPLKAGSRKHKKADVYSTGPFMYLLSKIILILHQTKAVQ